MFRGTTIEELINSVCRAEEHARQEHIVEEHQQASAVPALWEQRPQYQQAIEVV